LSEAPSSGGRPTIFVDGDACPVKAEVVKVAERHDITVVIVSNGGLRPSRDPRIRHVVVPKGADAADDWIAERIGENDMLITSDIPLASRALKKGASVIGANGKPFTEATIGMAVAMRDLNQHLRETGEIGGYNPGFTREDRSRFLGEFDRLVRRAMRPR
jgi:uncharacterized protein YaiI (UPF0178 family)